jgi:hypothetical protein
MSEAHLTVSELANVAADAWLGDSVDVVHRQLRAWAVAGLMLPDGGVFVGTGRPRQYCRESAYRASLLVRLAAAGLQIGPLRMLSETLDRALETDAEARRLWDAAIAGSEVVHLGYRFVPRTDTQEVDQAAVIIEPRDGDPLRPAVRVWRLPTIWIDLTDLFQGVRRRLYATA